MKEDNEIAEAISDTLKWNTSVPEGKIKFTVVDGIVTLQGELCWEYQRRDATAAVQILAGVRKVDNRIVVKPLRSPARLS